MGRPYSQDLRERIVGYVEEGHAARGAGRVFGVSASTAVRLAAAHWRDGSVVAKPQGRAPGTAGKLVAHIAFLVERVTSEPDITLQELATARREARGVEVQLSSIHRALIRAGYSYKKGLVAQERDRPNVRAARTLWITRRQATMRAEPGRLIFLDETSVKTNLTRLRGRALVGERLHGTVPFGKWRTQTFIAGRTSNQLIAPWVIGRRHQPGRFRNLCRDPAGAAAQRRNDRHPRQPQRPQKRPRRRSPEAARVLVPLPAALQS